MIASAELIIGMEVHVELLTRAKMFARAGNPTWSERAEAAPLLAPNSLVDETVLALPGALPTPNREAVELAIRVGLALGCRIAGRVRWDRKGYAYPDLPKGYQISQHDEPIARDGEFEAPRLSARGEVDPSAEPVRVRIVRAHLEEDAGKLMHERPKGAGARSIGHSIVDLNRAGTPLLEIVTAPDLRSAAEAVSFARGLREMMRWLGVSRCVMERGQMRFEPNINMRLGLADGRVVETPIVEVKNLNSFASLEGAIEHEFAEQPARFLADGRVRAPGTKTTRGWREPAGPGAPGATFLQRDKEDAPDYLYIPDPDLPASPVEPEWVERARAGLPGRLLLRRSRYLRDLSLSPSEVEMLMDEPDLARLFDGATSDAAAEGLELARAARGVANLLLQAGVRLARERGLEAPRVEPTRLAEIVALRERGEISAAGAIDLLAACMDTPGLDPRAAAHARGLLAVRDEASLVAWCEEAIATNEGSARDVRAGKVQAVGRLVGAVMKLSAGRADAARAREILLDRLKP